MASGVPLPRFVGVVHLAPFSGDPRHRAGGFPDVERAALRDAEALRAGGADGLIVENLGFAPFPSPHFSRASS